MESFKTENDSLTQLAGEQRSLLHDQLEQLEDLQAEKDAEEEARKKDCSNAEELRLQNDCLKKQLEAMKIEVINTSNQMDNFMVSLQSRCDAHLQQCKHRHAFVLNRLHLFKQTFALSAAHTSRAPTAPNLISTIQPVESACCPHLAKEIAKVTGERDALALKLYHIKTKKSVANKGVQKFGARSTEEGAANRPKNPVSFSPSTCDLQNDAHLTDGSYDLALSRDSPTPASPALRAARNLPELELDSLREDYEARHRGESMPVYDRRDPAGEAITDYRVKQWKREETSRKERAHKNKPNKESKQNKKLDKPQRRAATGEKPSNSDDDSESDVGDYVRQLEELEKLAQLLRFR
eukprot:Platyproteum_vivax@DN7193_c1_g1_i6.p1